MSLIPLTTWGQLPSDRKDYFHKMHLQFQVRHSSFLLHGVKDSLVEIVMEPNSEERITVYNWMKCQTLPCGSTELLVRSSRTTSSIRTCGVVVH
jgi:hypothetical protein